MHLALNYKSKPYIGIVLIPEKDELWIANGKEVWCEKRNGTKLNPNLSNLIIPEKHELVASNYGSPQGRKRGIAGDYVIPIKTHNETNAVQKRVSSFRIG